MRSCLAGLLVGALALACGGKKTDKHPHKLSGGMQQRVAIVQALIAQGAPIDAPRSGS